MAVVEIFIGACVGGVTGYGVSRALRALSGHDVHDHDLIQDTVISSLFGATLGGIYSFHTFSFNNFDSISLL